TLLKILAGVLPFERGERALGAHVAVHYYAQHQLDALTPTNTVLDELVAAAPDLAHTRLRAILGAFLFSGDAVDKKVSVLSGGEKARLALAKMLVRPAALLCLDEPTNHLDLASRAVLEEALAVFPGTIVFISHDRYFINRIGTEVTHVDHGRLTRYLGGYDDYVAATTAPAPVPAPARAPAKPAPRDDRRAAPPPRKQRVSAEVRDLRRRVEEVEAPRVRWSLLLLPAPRRSEGADDGSPGAARPRRHLRAGQRRDRVQGLQHAQAVAPAHRVAGVSRPLGRGRAGLAKSRSVTAL